MAFTLYVETFYFSPYVFSSFVALKEKKAAFDMVEVSLAEGANHAPAYANAAVTGRIPSLDHDGFRLAESSAIAEYLEEIFPPPAHTRLFPEAVKDRARARQIVAWMRSDLGELREDRSTATMFYKFPDVPLTAQAKKDADRLLRVADQMIPSGEGPLFGTWTLVDSDLAWMLHRLILKGDPVPERIAKYAKAQWARPSVQEFVQRTRPKVLPKAYWVRGTVAPIE